MTSRQRWPAHVESLDALHEQLVGLWSDHPEVGPEDRMAFDLAVAEVVANVLEHAQAINLWCEVTVQAGVVRALVEDDGVAPPDDVASAMVSDDPVAESGRGLSMASHLAEVAHTRADGRNRWEVRRLLSAD